MQYKWRILCLTAVTISGYVDTEAARGARQPAKAASGSLGRFVQDGVTTQEDPSGKQAETLLARLKAKGAHDRGKAQYAPKPISAIHSSEPAFRPYPEIAKAPTVRGNKTTTEWIDAGIDTVKFTRPGGTRTDAAYVTARKKQMLTLAPEHSRRQTLLASACSDGLETRSAWLVGKSGVDDRRYPPIDGIRSAAVSQAPQQAATNSQFTIPVYNGASPQFTALETLERAGATTPALMRDARTHPIWAIITGGREFSAKDKQRYIAQEKPDLMTTPLATGLLDESVLSVALGEDMNRTIRKCIRTEYGALPGTTIVSIRVAMAEAYRIFTETVRQKVTRTIERNSPMNMYDALRQTASRRGDAVPLALSDDLSDGQDPRARAREVYNSARLNDDGDIMPLPWSKPVNEELVIGDSEQRIKNEVCKNITQRLCTGSVATAEAAERAAELAEEVMHDFVNGDPGLNQVLNATYPLTMFATIPRLADCLARYALRNQDYGPKVNKEHPGPAFQMVNTIDMISQLCVTRLASDEIHDALKGEPELRDATEYDVMLSTLDKPEDVGDTGSTEEERADLDTRFHYGLYRYHDQIAQNRERCNRIRDEMKNARRNQYYIQDQDAHSMQVRYRQNMALAINALQETQPSEDVSNPDERMLLSIALGNSKYTGKQALNVNDAKEMAQWRRAVKSVAALTIWARARLKGGEPKRIVAEEIQSRQNVSEDLAIQIVVDAQEECATSTATFEPSKQARMLHLSLTTDTTWLDRMRSSVSFQTLHPRMRTDARNQTASPYRRNGSASKPVLAAYRVVAAYTVGLQSDHESTAQVYAMNRFGELRDANCRNEVIATDDKMEDQQVRELTSALGRVMVDDENVAPAVKVAKGYGISVEGGRSVNELIIDTFNAIGGNSSEILYKHEQYSDGLSIVAAALDLQMAYNEIKMLVKETVDADREAAAAALKSAAEQGPDANRGGGDDPALDEMLNLNKGEVQEAKKILLEIAQPKAKAPATN